MRFTVWVREEGNERKMNHHNKLEIFIHTL